MLTPLLVGLGWAGLQGVGLGPEPSLAAVKAAAGQSAIPAQLHLAQHSRHHTLTPLRCHPHCVRARTAPCLDRWAAPENSAGPGHGKRPGPPLQLQEAVAQFRLASPSPGHSSGNPRHVPLKCFCSIKCGYPPFSSL